MGKVIIKVKDLSKAFGDTVVLDGISFSLGEGQIFGFLGPSGSGKTTTINILTNQLRADKGEVSVFDKTPVDLTSQDFKTIGIVSDTSGFYEKMTLVKNLEVYAQYFGLPKSRVAEVLDLVNLPYDNKQMAEKLSTGMKQRLLLARALLNHPKLLFLDEPTSGLDPSTSHLIHDLLLDLKAKGVSIFLTTHDMAEATLLCDQVALLYQGKLVETGSPEALIKKHHQDKKVKLTYEDGRVAEVAYGDLSALGDYADLATIHSCEPTLEDIFISLTGGKLNA